VFLLATVVATVFVGFASPCLIVCHHTKCLFFFAIMLLFPLVFGALAYGSQRTSFTSRRLFWMISLIVAVAVWIFVFGSFRVTLCRSWGAESCGDYVSRAPVIDSFYLWQRPWLAPRYYVEMFGDDVGIFISVTFVGLLLSGMGILSVRHLWLLSRRHHNR